MLSFLPQSYKKLVTREYILRFSTVVLVSMTILGIAAALFLIPYIMFVGSQEGISASRLAFLENSSQTKDAQAFRTDLNRLRAEAVRLTPGKTVLPYELTLEIQGLVTPGITLSGITYSLNSDGSAALNLVGTAATREALQGFVASLQKAPGFTGVNVPVSAFAQDKNLEFNLGLKVLYETTN